MQRLFSLMVALVCVFVMGCEPPELETMVGVPASTGGPSAATRSLVPALDMEMGAAGPVAPPVSTPQQEPSTENQETVMVKADVGMTGKGQYNHGGGEKAMDIALVPVSEYFLIRERVALMLVADAENKYKAEHDNKLPDTHEEYMRDVIGGVQLPKLPDGHRFVYDPKKQGLYIAKPK